MYCYPSPSSFLCEPRKCYHSSFFFLRMAQPDQSSTTVVSMLVGGLKMAKFAAFQLLCCRWDRIQWVGGGSWINGGAEVWGRTGDHRFWRDWQVYRCPNLRLSATWSSTQVNKEQGQLSSPVPTKRPFQSRRIRSQQSHLLAGQNSRPNGPSSSGVNIELQQRLPRRVQRRGIPVATTQNPVSSAPSLLTAPTYCSKCGAKKFQYEIRAFCCADGQVEIAGNAYPAELLRLFTSDDEDAKHFRKYCRLYNNMFAFCSLGGAITSTTDKGIYVFKLHGQIYHYLPDLVPADGKPSYLQLYFYDTQHEHKHRKDLFKDLDASVIATLMSVLMVNPYARFFRCLREMDIDAHTTIQLIKNAVPDPRVFNAPSSDEVAAIWPNSASSSDCAGPSIIVSDDCYEPHRVKHYYGCYNPLQYPLLFPMGDNGWRPGLKKIAHGSEQPADEPGIPVLTSSTAEELLRQEDTLASQESQRGTKFISCRQYYCYLLQIRRGNYLLRAGRLLQQFIVDMYVKLENTRLDYFRHNQATIRAELY